MDSLPDEYYCWVDFDSTRNFDVGLWRWFQIAVKFGIHRWMTAARCKICGKLVGWSGCTGNLRKHLRVNHPYNVLPPVIQAIEGLKTKIEEIGSWDGDKYLKLLTHLVRLVSVPRKEVKEPKYPIWNFYERREWVIRTVRCRLCSRDVYWNRTGLEKLSRHVHRVHVSGSKRVRVEEMYRFCIRLGCEQFIEIIKMY